jgi:signal transduction histidine kinase
MASLARAALLSAPPVSDRAPANGDPLHAQKMAALGELASGITHDFRNILQTVISSLDIIESRSNDPAEVRRLARSALRASERGICLTKRLLKFARCEAADARSIDPLTSLESASETLARTIGARINVVVESPPLDLWKVVIDPTEFELALINLGINARDAMRDGGRIRFGARNSRIPLIDRRARERLQGPDQRDRRGPRLILPGGDYVAIIINDTGGGMDKATLARAGEPFFTTKPSGEGTGLGLSIVRDLAIQARGAFRVMSELGQGTTVEIWLPRAPTPIVHQTCREHALAVGQVVVADRPDPRAEDNQ